MMRRGTACAVLLAGVLGVAGAQTPEVRTIFRTEKVDGGWSLTWGNQSLGLQRQVPGAPAVTPDGRHAALVTAPVGRDLAFRLGVDAKTVAEWTAYSWVGVPALRDDGASWSVDARYGDGTDPNAFKIVDNHAYGPFRRTEPTRWSPQGNHWFFATEGAQGRGLVVDGKVLGPFQNIQSPAWDAAGTRLAFLYQKKDAWFVWVGREVGPFSSVQLITRDDGRWIGYASQGKDKRTTLVIEKAYGPYDGVDPHLDWMSVDGKRWMARVSKKGVWFLLDTGKETKLPNLSFSRLPRRGYVYRWGGFQNWSVNINGQVLGPFDSPPAPLSFHDGALWAFSYLALGAPPGRFEPSFVQIQGQKPLPGWDLRLHRDAEGEAFIWTSGGRDSPLVFHRWGAEGHTTRTLFTPSQDAQGWTLVADGQSFGPYADLERPVITGDGRHWAVLCRGEGGYLVLVDGVETPVADPLARVGELALAPDGSSWTFVAWPQKGSDLQVRITDHQVTGPFRWAGNPVYALTGSRSLVWAQTPDNKNWLSFAGQAYGPYARGGERHLYDLDAGHFVFGMQEKAGWTAVTDEGTFGPYQAFDPVPFGAFVPDGNLGNLFGFVGVRQDGRSELRVASGLAGGGKVYGPYRKLDRAPAYVADDGQDWIYGFEKDGGPWFLHNGLEVSTDGFSVRPLGSGYLMMIQKDGRESLVRNGATVGSWTKVFDWSVARDGQTWVAEVQEGEGPEARNLVVVNGLAEPGSQLSRRTGSEDRYTWFSLTGGEGQIHTLVVP